MGQLIEVETIMLGNVVIFDTDRTLSGQDGESFTDGATAVASGTYPGQLAGALFAHDDTIASVYVYSNAISVSRSKDWTDSQATEASVVVRNFLVHYEENRD